MVTRILSFILFTILFISCSLDYEGVRIDEELSSQTPQIILVNFKEVAVRKGSPSYMVEGERAEMFSSNNTTILEEISFKEYEKEGSVATEGNAEKAVLYTDTESIEFEKPFFLKSIQQGYFIEGDSANWDGERKRLTGKEDEWLTIGKEDGTFLKGKGFVSSGAERSFSFESEASGQFVQEEEEVENSNTEGELAK